VEGITNIVKILVIGGGPAGLNCAYWASKEGHDVELYEMRNKLAFKPCGEAVFSEGFDFVPIKPEESKWALNYIDKAAIYYGGEEIFEIDTKPYFGWVINKSLFLEDLMNQAVYEGAKIFLNKRIEGIEEEKYDLIVDAAGYVATYARRKGLDYRNYKLAPAIRGYGKTNKIKEDTLYIDFFGTGYVWIFPYGKGYVNYGVGGHSTSKNFFLERMQRFLKKFDVEPLGKIEGAAFPASGPLKQLRIGKVVVAGDSAGMVMPSSGEGIRFALFAGKNCFKNDYEKIFWEKYGERLMVGKKIVNFWMKLNEKEIIKTIKTLKPLTLIEAFIEGKKPSIFEGLKLISEPSIVQKALTTVYI
jgi:flavin-dependent dehydrogenase